MRQLSVMSLLVLLGACASTGPHTIDMMPAPAVFAGGEINPLPVGTPPVSYDDFPMFYATDRKPAESHYEHPFYLNEQGFVLRLGTARIKAGPEGMGWEEVRRMTLAEERTVEYPLQVLSVDETGVLASTVTVLNEPDPPPVTPDRAGREFAEMIDERLADSGVKDIYIYFHGYRVVFDNPLRVRVAIDAPRTRLRFGYRDRRRQGAEFPSVSHLPGGENAGRADPHHRIQRRHAARASRPRAARVSACRFHR
jgi:hypothetical protein